MRQQRAADKGLFDREPPQDLYAERSVLGVLLLRNNEYGTIAGLLKPEYFYLDVHGKAYRIIEGMFAKSIGLDAVTLRDQLQQNGLLEDFGGLNYIVSLMDNAPRATYAKHWADIIVSKWQKRSLIYSCTEMLRSAYEDNTDSADELLATLTSQIDKLAAVSSAEVPHSMHDLWLDYCEALDNKSAETIPTGFCDLDAMIGGLLPGEVYCIAARPGMGKTSFVLRLAINVSKTKHVYFQSLEMTSLELFNRVISQDIGYSVKEMRTLEKQETGMEILHTGSMKAAQINMTVDETSDLTVAQMAAKVRHVSRKNPVGLVVVDYLQLMAPEDRRAPREQQVSSISRALKLFAKRESVPVVVLSQMNRAIEKRSDPRPLLSDLREGGSIEGDCDAVIFIDRPSVYNEEAEPTEANLIVAKMRRAQTGDVQLHWDGRLMKFSNAAKSYQELESNDYFQ